MNAWQMVDSESLLHNKVCVKNHFLQQFLYLHANVPVENIFLLVQAPNTSKHISRNKGATWWLQEKQFTTKFF